MLRRYVPVVRRRMGVMVLGLVMGLGSVSAAQAQQKSPYAFGGDNAVFMNFIKPDKAADYEGLIEKLKAGLKASDKPERKQMAEGWKVYKANEAGPGGSVIYISVIAPVVKGTDYSLTSLLAEMYPAEARALYDTYVGAFPPPPTGQLFNMSLLSDLAK